MSEPTIKERLARLEALMEGFIHHQRTRDRWMMGILSGLVIGVVLFALPGCARLLGGGG